MTLIKKIIFSELIFNFDGNTASAALNSADDALTSVTNALKASGVTANDISTSSISVYPKYNYTNGTSVVVGYTVYLSLSVTVRGIDTNTQRIGKVVDALASSGATTSVYGLTYDTVDQVLENQWQELTRGTMQLQKQSNMLNYRVEN